MAVVCLMLIWAVSGLLTTKHGQFGPIVTDEYVAAWAKFFAGWCLIVSSAAALARGIYLVRQHGFKWKDGFWFLWGITQPIFAIAMGVLVVNSLNSFLEYKSPNMGEGLERVMKSEDAQSRWETTRMIAGVIYVDTGERRSHLSEDGRVVVFEPTQNDLKNREQYLQTVRQSREAVENVRSSFIVWGVAIAIALFSGFLTRIKSQRAVLS